MRASTFCKVFAPAHKNFTGITLQNLHTLPLISPSIGLRFFHYFCPMQIEFKPRRFFSVFFGLVFLWMLFLVSRFVLEAKQNLNHGYVPANAAFAMRIDGRKLLRSAAYDVTYHGEPDEIFDLIRSLTEKNPDNRKIRDAGIDFFSDVIVFGEQFEKTMLSGFIFNVSDAGKFSNILPQIIGKNDGFAVHEQVGIILSDPSKSISTQKLNAHAAKLLASNGKSAIAKKWDANASNQIDIEVYQPDVKASVHTKLGGAELELDGELVLTEKPVFSSHTLKPEGFHLSAYLYVPELQDSIQKTLLSKGFDWPLINRVSVNYRGTNIDNGIAPLGDLLLEFDSEITTRQAADPQSWQDLGFTLSGDSISGFMLRSGNISYTLRILDKKTLFLGQHTGNLLDQANEALFLLQGDPDLITNIEGGGLLGLGINLIPSYKNSKDFLASINKTNLKIAPENGKYALSGKITFQKGKYLIPETLRFILQMMQRED